VAEALWLMVIGMTTVFAFLSVLVMLMQLSSWVVINYLPEDAVEVPEPSTQGLAEIAVIVAAIESKRRGG
jgi:oxaloacetate decarboxylase (Na+ extruding) subunit gamma